MDASHNGNGGNMILTDDKSVFNYVLNLILFFLFYTVLTIIDHYLEVHSIPPLAMCVSHNWWCDFYHAFWAFICSLFVIWVTAAIGHFSNEFYVKWQLLL